MILLDNFLIEYVFNANICYRSCFVLKNLKIIDFFVENIVIDWGFGRKHCYREQLSTKKKKTMVID